MFNSSGTASALQETKKEREKGLGMLTKSLEPKKRKVEMKDEEDGLEESDESDGEESPKKRKNGDSDVTTATPKSPHLGQSVKAAAFDLGLANGLKSPNSTSSNYDCCFRFGPGKQAER